MIADAALTVIGLILVAFGLIDRFLRRSEIFTKLDAATQAEAKGWWAVVALGSVLAVAGVIKLVLDLIT